MAAFTEASTSAPTAATTSTAPILVTAGTTTCGAAATSPQGSNDAHQSFGEVVEGTQCTISWLQEFVQSCSENKSQKVLWWHFEQQLDNCKLLQFKGTVGFFCSGIPYQFSGRWQSSKKKAQRDAADLVYRYIHPPVAEIENARAAEATAGYSQKKVQHARVCAIRLSKEVRQEIRSLAQPQWKQYLLNTQFESKTFDEGLKYLATAVISIRSLTHYFSGDWCWSTDEAKQSLGERLLWYFGLAECEDASASPCDSAATPEVFEFWFPPRNATADESPHSSSSARPLLNDEQQSALEEKTMEMQIQNCLQKTFSKMTSVGQHVWVWTFEHNAKDFQIYRATAEIAVLKERFIGDWCKGKKQAKRNTCLVVRQFLEEHDLM
eukprot:TRINITY_DN28268_c0_g1_i14.p1 TRINITY_DN28268_c0_g1~~TRINITY_DN28268_c0_g1_i14.p1  ORF type:complete len:396 (-),score=82.98 TRINITY_DN28268_c0_g1_i14:142-1281(-)